MHVSHSALLVSLLDFVLYMSVTFFFSVYSNQVLGESLRITTDYLNIEEKVVVATLKAESVEVECSQLKKDLTTTMNEKYEANQKIKELIEALHVEKALVV